MRQRTKGMHGGQRMVEPPIKKAEPDDQWCRDPLQTLLKIGIVLSGQVKPFYIGRQVSA